MITRTGAVIVVAFETLKSHNWAVTGTVSKSYELKTAFGLCTVQYNVKDAHKHTHGSHPSF